MRHPLPSHGARVAHPRSEVIRQDGAPSTHTPREAAPGQKAATGPRSGAPRPFAAKHPRSQWPGALAITLASLLLTAVPAWLVTTSLTTTIAAAVVIALWCAALAAPALAGRANPIDDQLRRRHTTREGER